jgi:putative transposase
MVKPATRRDVVRHLQGAYAVGERRACHATGFRRSSQRYRSRRDPQTELRIRLRDLAAARVRYGYRRLQVLLRREGWPVNHKRTYRLYAEEGLSIRPKVPRRKRAWRYRVGRPGASAPNEVWSMDFVADQLFDGRPIRILAVLDAHTREALSIVPRASFRAFDVVAELTRLARERGRPKTLKVDNGPEFAGRLLDQWAHLNGVEIDFSRPGKPTDNAHIEAFNARLRAECLNASWFLSLADARDRLEAWRREYNEERPHGALRNLTPRAFAEQAQHARKVA